MKTLLCAFILLAVSSLLGQESLPTNYFKPTNIDLIGQVDSLFQVDFDVFNGEQNPEKYLDYAFDKQGNVVYYTHQAYGAYSFDFVFSVFDKSQIDYELINTIYGDADTNKFERDNKGHVVKISNSELFTEIQYDKNGRISQKNFGYVGSDFLSHTLNYSYTTADTYTETESSGENLYATREFIKGQLKLVVLDLVLGGSDITTYDYNENGDVTKVEITGPYTNLVMNYDYEYDDHNNWVKRTVMSLYEGDEAPSVSRISTRKLIYSDGHVSGYDVQY